MTIPSRLADVLRGRAPGAPVASVAFVAGSARRFAGRSALALALLSGCDDTPVVQSPTPAKPPPAAEEAKAAPEQPKLPQADLQETDFAETERSRDPFRSYEALFAEQNRNSVLTQRQVMLGDFSLDELTLSGIVTRVKPRAMLVDPSGKGHVITQGQYVGRAERVQAGMSGAEYEVNWRIDEIRDNDVVFVREDPSHPDVPSATKVIVLRSDESLEK